MIVMDFISSVCIAMIALSSLCLIFALNIQSNHEYDETDPKERQLRSFVVGITFVCLWALFQSIAYLAWDVDIISEAAQYKISLIGRGCGLIGLYKFFMTLASSLPHKKRFMIVWGVFFITSIYYVIKVSI